MNVSLVDRLDRNEQDDIAGCFMALVRDATDGLFRKTHKFLNVLGS